MPSLPQLPPELHTTKNLLSNLLPTLIQAFQMSSSSFYEIFNTLKPDLLIYDLFQPWAPKLTLSKGIPCVLFAAAAATSYSFYHHLCTYGTASTFPYEAIYLLDHEKIDLRACLEPYIKDADNDFAFGNFTLSTDIILTKSCRVVEGEYIDYLSVLCKKRIVPTGPLVLALCIHQLTLNSAHHKDIGSSAERELEDYKEQVTAELKANEEDRKKLASVQTELDTVCKSLDLEKAKFTQLQFDDIIISRAIDDQRDGFYKAIDYLKQIGGFNVGVNPDEFERDYVNMDLIRPSLTPDDESDYINFPEFNNIVRSLGFEPDKTRASTSFQRELDATVSHVGEDPGRTQDQIAKGLELCKANFLWIIRFPIGEENNISIEDKLPARFIDTVRDRGMVVSGWAPQARILAHPGIGGFMSHYGWSSITESMDFGVPIIAMPMKSEQPINARMVMEVGVGVEVGRDENGNYVGEQIAKAINNVITEKTFCEGMRNRAKKLSEEIKEKEEEEVSEAAEQLLRLCMKNKQQFTNK
ncbi:hypothetical protein BUALT_Bualt14G0027500 [Buddleja alternifolia]|uniref:Glycosyltransferase n=1 Tax=Buddleja alternifolia TaxID=168488 RepID=A0AAV6WNY4_9LAMI|nr:hypothetical protein BUALT_Bualt14G0027500 [Buddleja alternifolia]